MRTLVALLLLSFLSSCILMRPVPGERRVDPMVAEEAVESAEIVLEALNSNQDEMAAGVLRQMEALYSDEGTRAWIDGVRGVLEGRRLLASLDLSLVVVTEEKDGARIRRLVLRCRSEGGEGIVLHMSPPAVQCERSWLDTRGHGGSSSETVGLDWIESITLPGQEATDIPILNLDGARGQAAALRERWDLEMHFCYLEQAGQRFPVNAPGVTGVSRYLLAGNLALGPLGPEPLIELLERPSDPRIEQLVERGVRIPEPEMGLALDALSPVVARSSMARVERLAPVLCWLAEGSGESYFDPGSAMEIAMGGQSNLRIQVGGRLLEPRYLRSDPRAWKSWLERRSLLRGAKPESPLDLPDALGDAPGEDQP